MRFHDPRVPHSTISNMVRTLPLIHFMSTFQNHLSHGKTIWPKLFILKSHESFRKEHGEVNTSLSLNHPQTRYGNFHMLELFIKNLYTFSWQEMASPMLLYKHVHWNTEVYAKFGPDFNFDNPDQQQAKGTITALSRCNTNVVIPLRDHNSRLWQGKKNSAWKCSAIGLLG